MQYGYGHIDIDKLMELIGNIIKKNNETIQEALKDFIPLYERLRSVLEKTHES